MALKITYFVHGTTTDNEAGIATGCSPGRLSQKGIKQSEDLAKTVRKIAFNGIFASDLARAIDSAKLAFPGNNIITDRRLRECNYGDFTGKSADIVDRMTLGCVITPFPGGESYRDVEKRVRLFLEEISAKYDNRHIAIVSHRGPQLAMDVLCKGKSWSEAIASDWRHTKKWQPGWEYTWQ